MNRIPRPLLVAALFALAACLDAAFGLPLFSALAGFVVEPPAVVAPLELPAVDTDAPDSDEVAP